MQNSRNKPAAPKPTPLDNLKARVSPNSTAGILGGQKKRLDEKMKRLGI